MLSSSKLHAPSTLPRGNNHQCLFDRRLDELSNLSKRVGVGYNHAPTENRSPVFQALAFNLLSCPSCIDFI